VPSISDLATCRYILGTYRRWYESRVLGCSLSRWSEIRSKADLLSWLDEKPSHGKSELGFFIRISMSVGLQSLGSTATDAPFPFGRRISWKTYLTPVSMMTRP